MRTLLPLVAAFLSLALMALVPPASAKEAPAYIAIGDSLAFGVGASDPATDGYVAITYDALRRSERYRHRGLDLINLGVPGATTSDLLLPGGQLERAVAEIKERQDDTSSADDNVEIITVNIGGNDVQALITSDSPCLADLRSAECQDRFQETLDTLEEDLTQVLRRLRQAAPEADIVVLGLYSCLSGKGGAPELVGDIAVGEINAVTERVVSDPELRAKLVSVYSLFRGRASQLVAADNLHPNDDGHAVMAEVVLAAIEGREPVLPEGLMPPAALEEVVRPPLGKGGLLPVNEGEDGGETSLPLLLAVAIPASLLGLAAVAGAYWAARSR
jgi:acyl-CoA thioesterase-1